MAFLLIFPLTIFALVVLLVVSIFAGVEIAERRRPRRRSRRIFRPMIIEGGKGKIAAIKPRPDSLKAAPDEAAPESARIKLVRLAPL